MGRSAPTAEKAKRLILRFGFFAFAFRSVALWSFAGRSRAALALTITRRCAGILAAGARCAVGATPVIGDVETGAFENYPNGIKHASHRAPTLRAGLDRRIGYALMSLKMAATFCTLIFVSRHQTHPCSIASITTAHYTPFLAIWQGKYCVLA